MTRDAMSKKPKHESADYAAFPEVRVSTVVLEACLNLKTIRFGLRAVLEGSSVQAGLPVMMLPFHCFCNT